VLFAKTEGILPAPETSHAIKAAIDEARRLGVDSIGFSGGVACNEQITQAIRSTVEKNGLKFLVHELVPPGDGGISLGQAVAAAWQIKN
jgi:hydrogenase maturation protein HypF